MFPWLSSPSPRYWWSFFSLPYTEVWGLYLMRPDWKYQDWVHFSSTSCRTAKGVLLDFIPHVRCQRYLPTVILSDVIITSKQYCLCCATYAWYPRVQNNMCVANLAQNSKSYKMIRTAIEEEAWAVCKYLNGFATSKTVTNLLKVSISGHVPAHFNQQNLIAAIQSDAIIACKW
jgi:hypothetical protein